MALRNWRDHLVTLITDVSVLRRREVVLWRLRQTDGTAETIGSFTEASPETFHVLVTCDGRAEVRRRLVGIGTLMSFNSTEFCD
jgi:2-polyprenyl-6-methoxyphenol hydroxylase-like FAD-dependent oxidoreductase